METLDIPYIASYGTILRGPLMRYYPPIQSGVAASWLSRNATPGSWVLDPFGTSPELPIEMARSGYRVLVASNNPVTSFIIETLASAPRQKDLLAALADLAVSRKGEERLEQYIQSIYAVDCPSCGKTIQAKSFIWQRQAEAPERCLLECPFCGISGEHPVSPSSQERLHAILPHASHTRARALERVAPVDDPARPDVEQALQCYLSRPLYVLFTLFNKLETLVTSPSRLRLLTGLMLTTCDAGNTLWPYPNVRSRPRQLILPAYFRENNLWLALEEAVQEWQIIEEPIPVTQWPQSPPLTGGICLYPGRLKDLAADLSSFKGSIVTAIPRPNQAFWTLSALWAGWLWGRDAVRPLKSALTRQRYDWNWHTTALETTLTYLAEHTDITTPFFGMICEAEPAFISAAMIGASSAGFDLAGMALRPDQTQAQLSWKIGSGTPQFSTGLTIDQSIQAAILQHLGERGEPAQYITLHTAGVAASIKTGQSTQAAPHPAQSVLQETQAALHRIFNDRDILTRYGGGQHNLETGLFWDPHLPHGNPSLSDNVEKEIVRYLLANPETRFKDLDITLCQAFPGLLTPAVEYIETCLESYAERQSKESDTWQIRSNETPTLRREDLRSVQALLKKTGLELSYQVEGTNPISWSDDNGNLCYEFHIVASAMISRCINDSQSSAPKQVIVVPGSRANLIMDKLRHDPWLNDKINEGWTFLKFRHLRYMTSSLLLSRPVWEEWLPRDPLESKATQLEMF